MTAKLGAGAIPIAPIEVAIGIPADLLRRRPDVRRAERQAAAQSALNRIAESDLYPHISVTGTIGYSAEQFKDLFHPLRSKGRSDLRFSGTSLITAIVKNVRLQYAGFQELVTAYQNTVLVAAQEAENGLVIFLRASSGRNFRPRAWRTPRSCRYCHQSIPGRND